MPAIVNTSARTLPRCRGRLIRGAGLTAVCLVAVGCANIKRCHLRPHPIETSPAPIRSTFACDPLPTSLPGRYAHHWRSIDTPRVDLAIVVRDVPDAQSHEHHLSGFIPSGTLEGALHFVVDESDVETIGKLWEANNELTPRCATIRLRDDNRLELMVIGAKRCAKGPVLLEIKDDTSTSLLRAVPLLGHRALNFSSDLARPSRSTANTYAAIKHAWHFGASGIEVDIVMPYESVEGHRRHFDPTAAHVFHPWMDGSTVRADAPLLDRFPTASALFTKILPSSRLTFVYVDLKLHDDAAPLVWPYLNQIGSLIKASRQQGATADITIAAPRDEISIALAARPEFVHTPTGGPWSWTLELNNAASCEALAAAVGPAAAWRPDTLSIMLEFLPGNRGGLMDPFFADMDDDDVRALGEGGHRLVLWTVATEKQLDAALDIRRRFGWTGDGRVAIIVKHPHRMAFRMATSYSRANAWGETVDTHSGPDSLRIQIHPSHRHLVGFGETVAGTPATTFVLRDDASR